MTKKTLLESTLANVGSKFLNAVDVIIRKNRMGEISPDSERSISILVGPDATAIAKIRRGERAPTYHQILNLGLHFNLDFNYFFRRMPFKYELHNDKIFLLEKREELLVRMTERFKEEASKFKHIIRTYREEIQKLEKQMDDTGSIDEAKKVLSAAGEEIGKAFVKK